MTDLTKSNNDDYTLDTSSVASDSEITISPMNNDEDLKNESESILKNILPHLPLVPSEIKISQDVSSSHLNGKNHHLEKPDDNTKQDYKAINLDGANFSLEVDNLDSNQTQSYLYQLPSSTENTTKIGSHSIIEHHIPTADVSNKEELANSSINFSGLEKNGPFIDIKLEADIIDNNPMNDDTVQSVSGGIDDSSEIGSFCTAFAVNYSEGAVLIDNDERLAVLSVIEGVVGFSFSTPSLYLK